MTRISSTARLLAALGLTLTLTACNQSGEPGATTSTQAESTQAESTQAGSTQSASIPTGTPGASASAAALSVANVPTEDDMEWHKPGDWSIVGDQAGEGRSPASACQKGSFALLAGAGDMRNAQYVMGESENATALVIDFDSPESASAAYDTITGWSKGCDPAPSSTAPVDTATGEGEASFVEVTLPGPETSQTDMGTFQAIGTVVNGDRVAYVVMTITGMDNNWDYAPNGAVGAMHPMFRTLPKVSERIVK